jgi:uncharacterized protein YraI
LTYKVYKFSLNPFTLLQATYLLDTIVFVSRKILFLLTMIAFGCISCNAIDIAQNSTNTPSFVTATLPSTSATILPTQTAHMTIDPNIIVMPTIQPIEGTTTTQVNVRAETSTASDSLGIIASFSTIQIIGKESSGNWFQIIYTESTGWVRAEFVQINPAVEIPVVEIIPSNGSGRSGVVINGVNVRNGPGIEHESIGVLIQKDVVLVVGKDASGSWMQINFKDGTGWIALEFLQIENVEEVPAVGVVETTATAPVVLNQTSLPPASTQVAIQDGDSIQNPLVKTLFTENKTLQITGDVSALQGDNEDWVEFSSFTDKIVIETSCFHGELQVELWQADSVLEHFEVPCGNEYLVSISENESYLLRIFQPTTSESSYASYRMKIKVNR